MNREHPAGSSTSDDEAWVVCASITLNTPHVVRDLIVAVLALVFSILFMVYSRNAGHSFWVYWAPFILAGAALLLGIPVYTRQRRHMTEPGPAPAYR